MKIAIVGWGIEGQSAFKYFGPDNEYLIANEEPRSDFPMQTDRIKIQFNPKSRQPGLTGNAEDLAYLNGIEDYDKIIYSVTSYKNLQKRYGASPEFWQKATTVQHIFFESVKSQNIIGVTGTKGKGTTSTLIFKMLEAAGKKTYLGGNIGKSVLDFVKDVQPSDWVVLELSNFQLNNLPYSPHIAVCLMLTEEHMDWHINFEEYLAAKANIFKHQKPDDIAIFFAKDENSKKLADMSAGQKIPYFASPGAYVSQDRKIMIGEVEIMPAGEVKLLGEHNLQNICAAITAYWQTDQNVQAVKTVLQKFSGLEHRLEFVRELNGVKYYNDSFGTTPETAIVAMRAFKQPKIMIMGGSDKGLNFEQMADAVVNNNVKQAILIGNTAPVIEKLLKDRKFNAVTTGLSDMTSIVNQAHKLAQAGDVVLLSTGCASFGLFKDYKDRGNQFKSAVQALS